MRWRTAVTLAALGDLVALLHDWNGVVRNDSSEIVFLALHCDGVAWHEMIPNGTERNE
jgi:hypothetical protein